MQSDDRKNLVLLAGLLLAGLVLSAVLLERGAGFFRRSFTPPSPPRKDVVITPRYIGEDGGMLYVRNLPQDRANSTRSGKRRKTAGLAPKLEIRGVEPSPDAGLSVTFQNDEVRVAVSASPGEESPQTLYTGNAPIAIKCLRGRTLVLTAGSMTAAAMTVSTITNVGGVLETMYLPPGGNREASDDFMRTGDAPGGWQALSGRWELTALSHPDRSVNPFHLAMRPPGERWEDPIFAERIDVRRYGIGALIGAARGMTRVSRLSGNGPAARAGVQEEDIVLSAQGYNAPRRGRDDTVRLQLLRPSTGAMLNITVPKEEYRWGEVSSPVALSGGDDSSRGLIITGQPDWTTGIIEASVLAGQSSKAGLAFHVIDAENYTAAILSGEGKIRIARYRAGREEVLNEKAYPAWPGTFYRLGVVLSDGMARVSVDGAEALAAPTGEGYGFVGLVAEALGSGGRPERPPLFDDFAYSGEVTGTRRAMSPQEQAIASVSSEAITTETSTRDWASPAGEWLYDGGYYRYRYPVYGDAVITAGAVPGRTSVVITPENENPADWLGEAGAEQSPPSVEITPQIAPCRIRISQDTVTFESVGGKGVAASTRCGTGSNQPLPEVVSRSMWRTVWVRTPGNKTPAGWLRVVDSGAYDEAFEQAPVRLLFTNGFWGIANKWVCDPRFSYLSARTGELAAAWWKGRVIGDFTADYYAATFMEILDEPFERSGDYNFALSTEPGNIGGGYTLSAGEDYDFVSRLRRKGTVLAETFAPGCQPPSNHLYLPLRQGFHRYWTHVRLSRRGNTFTCHINGREAFTVTDNEPLSGPLYPAVWTQRNSFHLGRLRITGEIEHGWAGVESGPSPPRAYDDGTLTNLWAGVPSASVEQPPPAAKPTTGGLIVRQAVSGPMMLTLKKEFGLSGADRPRLHIEIQPLSSDLALAAYVLPANAPPLRWKDNYGDGQVLETWPSSGPPPWSSFRPRLYDRGVLGFVPLVGDLSQEVPFLPLPVLSRETAEDGTITVEAEMRLPDAPGEGSHRGRYIVAVGCLHRAGYKASGLGVNPPGASYLLKKMTLASPMSAAQPARAQHAAPLHPDNVAQKPLLPRLPSPQEPAETGVGEERHTGTADEKGPFGTRRKGDMPLDAAASTPDTAPAKPSTRVVSMSLNGRRLHSLDFTDPLTRFRCRASDLVLLHHAEEGGYTRVAVSRWGGDHHVTLFEPRASAETCLMLLEYRAERKVALSPSFGRPGVSLVWGDGEDRYTEWAITTRFLDAAPPVPFTADGSWRQAVFNLPMSLAWAEEDTYGTANSALGLADIGWRGMTVGMGMDLKYAALLPIFTTKDLSFNFEATSDVTDWRLQIDDEDAVVLSAGDTGPLPLREAVVAAGGLKTLRLSALEDGIHHLALTVCDAQGNWSAPARASFALDTTGPTVEFVPEPPDGSPAHSLLAGHFVIRDNLSGLSPYSLNLEVADKNGRPLATHGIHNGLEYDPVSGVLKFTRPTRPEWCQIPEVRIALKGVQDMAGNSAAGFTVPDRMPQSASARPQPRFETLIITREGEVLASREPAAAAFRREGPPQRESAEGASAAPADKEPPALIRKGCSRENTAGAATNPPPPVVFFEPGERGPAFGPKGLAELMGGANYFNWTSGQVEPHYNVSVGCVKDAGLGGSGGGVLSTGPGEWRATIMDQHLDASRTRFFALSYRTTQTVTSVVVEVWLLKGQRARYVLPLSADGRWRSVLLDLAAAYDKAPGSGDAGALAKSRSKYLETLIFRLDLVGFTDARQKDAWPQGSVFLDAIGPAWNAVLRVHPHPGFERAPLYMVKQGVPPLVEPLPRARLDLNTLRDATGITVFALPAKTFMEITDEDLARAASTTLDLHPLRPSSNE